VSHKTSTAAPRDAIVLTLLNACCNFIKIKFYEVVRFRDGFIIGRVFVCDALLNRSSLWRLLRVFRVTDDNAGGASSKKNLTFPSANQAICRNNLLAICFDFTVYIYIYLLQLRLSLFTRAEFWQLYGAFNHNQNSTSHFPGLPARQDIDAQRHEPTGGFHLIQSHRSFFGNWQRLEQELLRPHLGNASWRSAQAKAPALNRSTANVPPPPHSNVTPFRTLRPSWCCVFASVRVEKYTL